MDQSEDRKRDIAWYDWLIFVVPTIFVLSLGLESAFGPAPGPDGVTHRDFRAVAHWFDPVFFQYNLVMTLMSVLVVPLLALSYTKTMANRKERRLQHDVPPERRGEIRKRMGERASFSSYRGSVWLTTVVVLLGSSILLLFKPVSSSNGMGMDFSLGANMLTMGPFAELYEKNPDAYFSHFIRNQIAFQFGFLGAYVYFIGAVMRAYFTMDLTSHTFVDGAIRMIVASILALVLSFAFDFILPHEPPVAPASSMESSSGSAAPPANSTSADISSTTGRNFEEDADKAILASSQGGSSVLDARLPSRISLLPIIAFFLGFYPKRAALGIERIVVKATSNIIPGNSYRALPLSMLSGMSYPHELRLEREGFDNVENLSNADAVDLAIRTCFSYIQLKQWIDQAWLAAHLREDYPDFVRRTGITDSAELQYYFSTCDCAKVDGVERLLTALSSDAASNASWKLRLATVKILLEKKSSPPVDSGYPRKNEHIAA